METGAQRFKDAIYFWFIVPHIIMVILGRLGNTFHEARCSTAVLY